MGAVMAEVSIIGIVTDPCEWRDEGQPPCGVLEQVLAGLREFGIPAVVCSNRTRDEIERRQSGEAAFGPGTEWQTITAVAGTSLVSAIRAAHGDPGAERPIVIGIGSGCDDLWLLSQVDIPFVIRSASQPPPPREFASAWVAVEDLPDGLRAALGETLDELSRDAVASG